LIKSSGLEAWSHEQFKFSSQMLLTQQTALHTALARNKLLYSSLSAISFSMLLYIGIAYLSIPWAQFFILLMIYVRILPMIASAQQIYQNILQKIPGYEHVQLWLSEAHQNREISETIEPIEFYERIIFEDISFQYAEKERWIFRGLSLSFKKNTTTAIIGPSGSGKTTLVDLMVGLIEPSSGRILIDGLPFTPKHRFSWRQHVAYMTQDIFLFNATIRENLLWSNMISSTEDEIREALVLAAAEFVFELPQGLDTLVGDNGVFFSGGERQRLGLARAILQKPSLLILDESTNALDDECTSHIHESLMALKGRMTMIIISHQELPQTMIDQIIRLGDELHPYPAPRSLNVQYSLS
jgi:ATP-binding cassette, subfamily C, bacterial